MLDLISKVTEAVASDAVTGNTLITGTTIDRASYGTVAFVLHTGTLTTGGATYAVTVEHGDAANMSDAVTVDTVAKGLVGTLPAIIDTDDNKCFKFGYGGSKRYVRVKIQPAGSTGAATIFGLAILGKPAFSLGSTLP